MTYSPSSGSSFSLHQRQHVHEQLPLAVPILPASAGANSHYTHHVSKVSQQAVPTMITVQPAFGGGSHSVHTESRFGQIKSTPVTPIIYPVLPTGSSHASTFRESHSSNHVAPQVAVYHPAPSTSSHYSNKYSSSTGNFGGNVGLLSYPSLGSSSSRFSEDSSSSSGNYGSNVGVIGFPSSSQITSRFGSEFGSSGASSNLNQYMSESERLARLQAQNIQSSSGYKASSVADFGAVQSVPVSTGGRTKSWEKSSKWASQSEVSNQRILKFFSYSLIHFDNFLELV